MPQAAGLLLAAGAGRRFGTPKALLRMDGRLLVERATAILFDGGCAPVFVVLGAAAQVVRATADLADATAVINPDWESGMGSSLRAGLRELAQTEAVAVVVTLVDLPGMTAAAVCRIAQLARPDALVAASYGGRRSHPVLFGREHWAGIADLATGDVGAKPYLRAHAAQLEIVACDDLASDADVDTPESAGEWGITR